MIDTSTILDFDNRVEQIKSSIKSVKDFPIEGILFRDITTLLEDPKAYKQTIDLLYEVFKDQKIDAIAAADARGFLFGSTLAYLLGCKLVLVRKPGKLPRKTISQTYDLEYGHNTLCMHKDAIKPGQKVVIIDDLLATGGTMKAAIKLVESLGGIVVGLAFLVELLPLKGGELLSGYDIFTLIKY